MIGNNVTFANPEYFWLLLALPVALAWYLIKRNKQSAHLRMSSLTGFGPRGLLDRLYPHGEAVVIERVVDVHIGKLRQKIEPDPAHPRHILTARGIGYRFADPAEPEESAP